MDEQRIREIIREELAAHEERLKEKSQKEVTDFLAATNGLITGSIISTKAYRTGVTSSSAE